MQLKTVKCPSVPKGTRGDVLTSKDMDVASSINYCSFSHQALKNDKHDELQDLTDNQAMEIMKLKSRIEKLESENSKIKEEMESVFKFVKDNTEKAILTTTETVLKQIKSNQDMIHLVPNLRLMNLKTL